TNPPSSSLGRPRSRTVCRQDSLARLVAFRAGFRRADSVRGPYWLGRSAAVRASGERLGGDPAAFGARPVRRPRREVEVVNDPARLPETPAGKRHRFVPAV